MVGHWPGFYFNGREVGFAILKEVVRRLHDGFDHLVRSPEEFQWLRDYVAKNPLAARLLEGEYRHWSRSQLTPVS